MPRSDDVRDAKAGIGVQVSVRRADAPDMQSVRDILGEAARWLEERGEPLWGEEHLRLSDIASDVQDGLYFVAELDDTAVGVVRYQLSDELFWPDVPTGESAFIHRLAVRRSYAGGQVSRAILDWAVDRTANLGLRYLRLDCALRPRLQRVYERYGFRRHSTRDIGSFRVARYELRIRAR